MTPAYIRCGERLAMLHSMRAVGRGANIDFVGGKSCDTLAEACAHCGLDPAAEWLLHVKGVGHVRLDDLQTSAFAYCNDTANEIAPPPGACVQAGGNDPKALDAAVALLQRGLRKKRAREETELEEKTPPETMLHHLPPERWTSGLFHHFVRHHPLLAPSLVRIRDVQRVDPSRNIFRFKCEFAHPRSHARIVLWIDGPIAFLAYGDRVIHKRDQLLGAKGRQGAEMRV